jgi:CRISPR/Cas system-associated exonuclease Cas4 (RecB family)
MRIIRASEVGSFLYCRRAWWYQKLGKPSKNQPQLDAGSEFHVQHGRQVARASLLRILGSIVLLAGILLLAFYFAGQIIK